MCLYKIFDQAFDLLTNPPNASIYQFAIAFAIFRGLSEVIGYMVNKLMKKLDEKNWLIVDKWLD